MSLGLTQREQLAKLLTKSNFFRELALSVQTKIPEIAQCVSKPAGSIVFRQGDTGLQCYVVLSGKVSVWIAPSGTNKEEDEDAEESSTKSPSSCSADSAESLTSTAASETPFTFCDSNDSSTSRVSSKKMSMETCDSSDEAVFNGRRLSLGASGALNKSTTTNPTRGISCRPTITTVASSGKTESKTSAIPRGSITVARRNSLSLLPKLEDASHKRKTLGRLDLDHLKVEQHFDLAFGNQVATLGPGSIFGELALLHEQPRNATITCSEDCELIVIKKEDFNVLLKQEIQRAKHEKMMFLQVHCPGCKRLSALRMRKINTVMYSFEKLTVPRGHSFFKQGAVSPVGVYLVVSGSVELRSKGTLATTSPGLYKPQTHKLGALLKGAAFGCPLPGLPETFGAIATSSCEVYCSTGANFLRLPRSIQQAIQDNLIETMLWRVENFCPDTSFDIGVASSSCNSSACYSQPCSPAGSAFSGPLRAHFARDRVIPSKASVSQPASPSRCITSEKRWHGEKHASQCLEAHDLASKSIVVDGVGNVVTGTRLPRSFSSPVRLQGASPYPSRVSRSSVLRDESLTSRSSPGQITFSDSLPKESAHFFNLAMERCRAFGGHRLRAVRKDLGSSSSLLDQLHFFRRCS